MSVPVKPWENMQLQNSANIFRGANPVIPQIGGPVRTLPALPPRPQQNSYSMNSFGSYSPYSSYGGGMGYGSIGSMPYRSSMYSPYSSYSNLNSYGGYGGYGMSNYGARDNAEERFVQYAEERSRSTFTNVENVVRAFSSISMMLDNTFFAMTSSFRAVLSVAENFGRLRTVFGQIWYSINLFRLFSWLYNKLRQLMGYKVVESSKSLAWNEAVSGAAAEASGSGGSNWPTLAFLGIILSAPYLISKLLPKYEDKCDPEKWLSSGIRAKAAFDFASTSSKELSLNTNDEVILAPKHIQEEMKLSNTGWAFATCNNRSGIVPLNYLVVMKKVTKPNVAIPAPSQPAAPKGNGKRVSFGETKFFDPEQNNVEVPKSGEIIEPTQTEESLSAVPTSPSNESRVENDSQVNVDVNSSAS